jgi:hypothetical protein
VEPLRYDDFDLKITREGKQYKAQVLESPSGEASHVFKLPFNRIELENLILRLGKVRGSKIRGFRDEMEAAREIGGRLFEAVFGGNVQTVFRSSVEKTRKDETVGLRLKLKLQEVPELTNIPWEFLFDEMENSFLAQSNQTPIIRYRELARGIKPLQTKAPIRILVMISNPSDLPQLDVKHEWKLLKEAFKAFEEHGIIEMKLLENATSAELMRTLHKGTYHIFHYIGHSLFDERQEIGILALEDEYGKSSDMRADRLATLLNDHQSMRLVLLNSCESAKGSPVDPFAGVATSLIQKGIPAVIAMQFSITDKAAIAFAQWFYWSLAQGFPVDAAVATARKAIYMLPNNVEWGTPVLYMRSKDGNLFDLDPQEKQHVAELKPVLIRDDGDVRDGVGIWQYVIGGLIGVALIVLLVKVAIPGIIDRTRTIPVKITSAPSDAYVQIDGKHQEEPTPNIYLMSPSDSHDFVVSKTGFTSDTSRRFIEKGKTDTIHIVLQSPGIETTLTQLTVTSDPPGAQVFVNREETRQRTPATIPIRAGYNLLELKKEHDNPELQYYCDSNITVLGNQINFMNISMQESIKPVIIVRSDPRNATILIDEIHVGNTDRRINVLSGKHTIQLTAPGYRPYTFTIDVEEEDSILLPRYQLVPN